MKKAGDVKDASLVSPPGIDGTVVDVQVFTRKGQEKISVRWPSNRKKKIGCDATSRMKHGILREQRDQRIRELLEGRKLSADLTVNREVVIPKGVAITREMLEGIEAKVLRKVQMASTRVDVGAEIKRIRGSHRASNQNSLGYLRREDCQAATGRRTRSRRDQDGEGLYRHEAQAFSRRQDGRTSRQQGCHCPDLAGRGHAFTCQTVLQLKSF